MKAREVFADPQAVANFLKAHFYGREYESFVVLYLDAQHRLIEVEEAFHEDADANQRVPPRNSARQRSASIVRPSYWRITIQVDFQRRPVLMNASLRF